LIRDHDELLAWMRERTGEMVAMTTLLAEAESPSRQGEVQEEVRSVLEKELGALGLEVERVPGTGGCDHLTAKAASRGEDGPTQLLLGHFDTVWPVGTLAEMPVVERDGRLHGPGVFDMKGGLVQMLFALRAARELQFELECRPVVMLNADEEIGSLTSRDRIVELARGADRTLVMEPSYGPGGSLKTGRKGVGHFSLRVKGVASHAGLDPEGGASAILELSEQVQSLFGLNDPERGITVNVGTIDGGLRANIVAPEATAEIESRVFTSADAESVESAIRSLEPHRERISLEVSGGFGRPPLEPTPPNRALWEVARREASELGLDLGEARVGGASDGNLTSPHCATLDGLGAVGDGAHADHEHLVIDRMPERAALIACLLAAEPGAERAEAGR
jgi:glutamate carboxypeptidase